jgi:hypothetical protein
VTPRAPGSATFGEIEAVLLVDGVLQAVVGLGDTGRREGVRRDDVRPSRQVRVVDGPDHVRAGQREEVVVAAQVAGMVAEPFSAEIRFGQAVALNQRPRRAVQDKDPLLQQGPQEGDSLLSRPDGRRHVAAGGGVRRGNGFRLGGKASFFDPVYRQRWAVR